MVIILAALFTTFGASHAASPREQRFQLSIERGPLAFVLAQLAEQTGVNVGTEIGVANSPARDFGPFKGRATADEAMKRLLSGTNLWYAWRDQSTIRLFLLSSQRTNWRSGGSTAKEASDAIRSLSGARYETGSCGGFQVGPFRSDEPITAEAFWIELIKPYCAVKRKRSSKIEPGSIDRLTLAGQTEHDFSIAEMSRVAALQRVAEQANVAVNYVSSDALEELALVAPITGQMSLNEALKQAMHGSVLHLRWIADNSAVVEPAYTVTTYADMSKCSCNFGFPEWRPLETEHLTVIESRLPPLDEDATSPATVLDRHLIEASGASTIPEFLNNLSQQAFSRSRSYRSNAAQYFEGRGFGSQYALVLIDGFRAYGSAGDPMTNAFDLNAVPLSAVDHIDISLDRPSVLYGTDAFGGTANIVLKRDLEKPAVTLSLGSARGGAEKNLATLMVGGRWQGMQGGFVFDHLVRGDLPGSTRGRWRNQDYRDLGGDDYRLPFGVPPNVRASSGQLPGYDASSAEVLMGPEGPVVRPNVTNRQSALAYASITPEQERSSLYGFANAALGRNKLQLSLLLGQQSARLRLFPESAANLTWGEYHWQNPFGDDVVIDAMLTGLPPRTQEAESTLARLTSELSGPIGGWKYSAFVVGHRDRSRLWIANLVNPVELASSLTSADRASALNVLGDRPGAAPLPADLLLPRKVDPYETEAMQLGFDLSGALGSTWAGAIKTDVGVTHRHEAANFDPDIGRLGRNVTSLFSLVRIPLVSAAITSPSPRLQLAIGGRRDFHSDVRDVTTWQSGLTWRPLSAVTVRTSYSELFRPPSLFELYLPRFTFPFQIYDPRRNEPAAVTIAAGGNPSLRPTAGRSIDAGFSIDVGRGWKASLGYWDTRMENRVSVSMIPDLLDAHDDVAGHVIRAERTADDLAANLPGRVLLVDTTRANFGATNARGFDLSLEHTLETSTARITSRIDFTRTVDFRYRDLPAASSPMLDRAGVASLFGTVPSRRVVASFIIEFDGLRVSTFARHHSSYKDYSIVAGAATDHGIPAQTVLDLKVTKDLSEHFALSFGANNVLDDQPPFAQSGGWEGFDSSQGDLLGREAFFDITGSF